LSQIDSKPALREAGFYFVWELRSNKAEVQKEIHQSPAFALSTIFKRQRPSEKRFQTAFTVIFCLLFSYAAEPFALMAL